jgi:DNA polymerase-3 subunit gamma/tau
MSYQVIARKWRPQTFEEVTGQETITQTLRNALEYDRLHHAYLFSGARGVGKTTTARLLAKALNCHKTEGKPNITPCRTDASDACPSCIEISESRSLDVLEIDAASHTGVDDIRDTILEGINISPARDRFKVFIIDEVHMLSKSSFNALLKTLEEPPPNVVFIMATTELHKVPETILSRCQEFEFRTIPLQKIFDRLKLIAGSEKIDITDEALKEISRSGEGSMRDAQSNFDQVISFSGERIDVADVTKALGMAGSEMLVRILTAIEKRQPRLVLEVVADLTSRGQDLRNFCRDLLALCRDLLVFKVSDGDETLAESAALTPAELREHAEKFTAPDLVRFFNSLSETESKLREATNARYVVEIGLVKLVEMRSIQPVEKLLERLSLLEQNLTNGQPATQPSATSEEKKTLNAAPAAVEPPTIDLTDSEIDERPKPVPVNEPKFEEPAPVTVEKVPSAVAVLPDLPPPAYDLSFLDSIDLPLTAVDPELLEHVDDDRLDDAYEQKLVASGDDLKPIARASEILNEALRKRSRNDISVSGANGSTAASAAAPAREVPVYTPPQIDRDTSVALPELSADPSEEELLAYAQAHPVVRNAIRIFGGTIRSVRKR